MKIDAFYFERVCMELGQIEYYPPLMYSFIEKLQDRDTVAFVGCGLQPYSVLALDRLCDKDITIIGIDPLLQKSKTESKRIMLIDNTLERFLGVKSDNELGTSQEMIKQAVNHDARLIAMYCCACEDAHKSKSLEINEEITRENCIDDLKLYLEKREYSVNPIKDNKFAFLAEKLQNPCFSEIPEGMSKEYYAALTRHGHFD